MLFKLLKEMFEEESVWIGWSVYWRFQLFTVLAGLPLMALISLSDKVAFIVGSLTAAIVTVILGIVVRWVAIGERKISLSSFTVYLGWATFWRYMLFGLPGGLMIVVVFVRLAIALNSDWITLVSTPPLVLWFSACMGWAVRKVLSLPAVAERIHGTDRADN